MTLRYAIDDFEFNGEQFKDYMFNAFDLLFALLKEGSECETKVSFKLLTCSKDSLLENLDYFRCKP